MLGCVVVDWWVEEMEGWGMGGKRIGMGDGRRETGDGSGSGSEARCEVQI